MLKNIRSYFYQFKKYQSPLERYFFPLALLLYPLVGVTAGVDITDTTYSLANYEFIHSINPMWMLSTYLSNIVGSFIMHLPGGGTMLGMGIYCSFVISIIALIAYYGLQSYMPGWMIFIGCFMAESFSWCPRVIMYNYLTYLFFTAGALTLLKGIFAWENQGKYLFLAGVFLGLNVMVRFPNLTEAALILVLWFYSAITKEPFYNTFKKTCICIFGYAIGFGIPLVIISKVYGSDAYLGMIGNLFGMTEGASDYTTSGMITVILQAYASTAGKALLMLPCIAAGIIMFMLKSDKYIWIKKVLYVGGLLILVKYYFSTGVFTRNYFYYDSIFQVAMMFVLVAILLGIIGSTGVLNGDKQEQALAFLILIIILITPLGSNNYTYPVINNLYLVAPITLWLMRRLMQRLGDKPLHFAWQSMITMVIIMCLVQGVLFRCNFSFVDGADGTVRNVSSANISKVKYMVTSENNLNSLEELNEALFQNGLLGKETILFGGVPGLSYVFDLEPAIDTVWPDLDSYSVANFNNQLLELSATKDTHPTVIIGKDMAGYANIAEKYDILLDYIANHDYNKVFESERFIVFAEGIESEG